MIRNTLLPDNNRHRVNVCGGDELSRVELSGVEKRWDEVVWSREESRSRDLIEPMSQFVDRFVFVKVSLREGKGGCWLWKQKLHQLTTCLLALLEDDSTRFCDSLAVAMFHFSLDVFSNPSASPPPPPLPFIIIIFFFFCMIYTTRSCSTTHTHTTHEKSSASFVPPDDLW